MKCKHQCASWASKAWSTFGRRSAARSARILCRQSCDSTFSTWCMERHWSGHKSFLSQIPRPTFAEKNNGQRAKLLRRCYVALYLKMATTRKWPDTFT